LIDEPKGSTVIPTAPFQSYDPFSFYHWPRSQIGRMLAERGLLGETAIPRDADILAVGWPNQKITQMVEPADEIVEVEPVELL